MLGYAPILDREFTLKLKKLAETHEIPVQHEPMGGRTTEGSPSVCGLSLWK